MSRSKLLLGTSLAIAAMAIQMGPVGATLETHEGQAGTADATPGFQNPSNADKGARGYVNPCLGHEGFEAHVSRRTDLVKNAVENVSVVLDGNVLKFMTTSAPGTSLGYSAAFDPTFEVVYVEWVTACAPDVDSLSGAFEPGTEQRYWVKRPTQGAILPGLVAEVTRNLEAPDIFWPNADPEFDWVYVTVDNDLRIAPVANVRSQRTVSNLVGSVTVWVEATPSHIVFDPGEPDSRGTECSYEQATSAYAIEFASSCFYRYANSSSIAKVVKDAFVTRTSMYWDLSASGPLTTSDPESWREETIQVASVQALVIATATEFD